MARKSLKRGLVAIAVAIVLFLAARAFVGDVYRIGSASMEPTLAVGDRVFVRFDSSPPERFELVALRRGDEALVKRVAGLPGETVSIDPGGDLLIDGKRLPPDAPRPPPILVFDSRRASIREHFRLGSSTANPWTEHDGVWELDARGIGAHEGVGLMGLLGGLRDDHLGEHGEIVRSAIPVDVGDAIVACAFRPLEPGGRVVLALDEQGDVFRFTVEIGADGSGEARLSRYACGDVKAEEELASARVRLASDEWTTLIVSNVDNHLALECDGELVFSADYATNRLHPLDEAGVGRSFGERVKIGGEGARLQIRDLCVWRDLHYVAPPDAVSRRPVHLGTDEYYLLGDNSRSSRDSRDLGPLPADSIFGRPIWVVWPPRSIRALRAAGPARGDR